MYKCLFTILFSFFVVTSASAQASDFEKRSSVISNILDRVELAIEYQMLEGEQEFTMVDDNENVISKLIFPFKGSAAAIRAEVDLTDKLSVAAKYGASDFDDDTSSDEDWNFVGWHNGAYENIDYQKTEQKSNTEIKFWQADMYYRLMEETEPRNKFLQALDVNEYSLDLSAGYQYYESNSTMKDPTTNYIRLVNGTWWEAITLPFNSGLNSTYNVEYQGPRLGMRFVAGDGKKIETEINTAVSLLETKAKGYWNLRDYHFTQKGKNGLGVDFDVRLRYKLTDSWSVQLGYLYSAFKQKKLKESGTQPGYSYSDEDIVRDANMSFHGPVFAITFRW